MEEKVVKRNGQLHVPVLAIGRQNEIVLGEFNSDNSTKCTTQHAVNLELLILTVGS